MRAVTTICTLLLAVPLLASSPVPAKASDKVEFTILHTNDEHSALIPRLPAIDQRPAVADPSEHSTVGGFARLAMLLEEIREKKRGKDEPTFTFNAGDFLGGSPFGWLALEGYAPELTLLQQLGFDAAILGNHEFDYGPQVLLSYLRQAGYPEAHQDTVLLASNFDPPSGHPLSQNNLLQNTHLVEKKGLTVGLLGLIGDGAVSLIPDAGNLNFQDPVKQASRSVKTLQKQGAEVIVALTHSGLEEDRKLAAEVEGIDVVIGGHCHTALHRPVREKGTIIAQAGSRLNYLGKLELTYDPEQDVVELRSDDEDSVLIPIDNQLSPQDSIRSEVENYQQKLEVLVAEMTDYEEIREPVAQADFGISNEPPLEETPMGNLVTDAMRLRGQKATGYQVDVAVQAAGNIRRGLFPAAEQQPRGELSFYDTVSPVALGHGEDGKPGYPLMSVYLSGQELKALLEVAALLREVKGEDFFLHFSGLSYDYNPADVLLFTVPLFDKPVPTTRAVKRVQLYTGRGQQGTPAKDSNFVPLEENEEKLYHVVTDSYLLSYLPMVGDLLPGLKIVPKNRSGRPISTENLQQLVIRREGEEFKVWQAVLGYIDSLPAGEDGNAAIPDYYRETSGRINKAQTFPYSGWALIFGGVLFSGVVLLGWRVISQ
ncbi:MAG: bifunctional metallophosphatase/5'-nucleotidase [Candidatus Bipolaricaulota bacterium]